MNVYEYAKERYAALGIDTEAALTALRAVPVSPSTAGRATTCAALTATPPSR